MSMGDNNRYVSAGDGTNTLPWIRTMPGNNRPIDDKYKIDTRRSQFQADMRSLQFQDDIKRRAAAKKKTLLPPIDANVERHLYAAYKYPVPLPPIKPRAEPKRPGRTLADLEALADEVNAIAAANAAPVYVPVPPPGPPPARRRPQGRPYPIVGGRPLPGPVDPVRHMLSRLLSAKILPDNYLVRKYTPQRE
jgi:hypothetical protein